MANKLTFDFKIDSKRNIRKILNKAGKAVLKYFIKNYTLEGSEDIAGTFQPWAKRKTFATAKGGEKTRKVLYKTGNLKKGFVFRMPNTNTFEISNKVDYFKYHQTGDGQVVREMLYESPNVRKVAEDIIIREVELLLTGKK